VIPTSNFFHFSVFALFRDAMQMAARNGSIPMLSLLKEWGGSVNSRGNQGDSLFHLAAHNGHFKAMRWLASCGIEKEILDNFGQTAVHVAAKRGELEILVYLHEELQADFTIQDCNGLSPLELVPSHFCEDEEKREMLKECKKVVMLAAADRHRRNRIQAAAELRWADKKAKEVAKQIEGIVLSRDRRASVQLLSKDPEETKNMEKAKSMDEEILFALLEKEIEDVALSSIKVTTDAIPLLAEVIEGLVSSSITTDAAPLLEE
jgi:hypothetical protein